MNESFEISNHLTEDASIRLDSFHEGCCRRPSDTSRDHERSAVEVFSSEGEEMFRGEAEGREGSLRFGWSSRLSAQSRGREQDEVDLPVGAAVLR